MGYVFLLPLVIASLSTYIWQKSQDEIAYLSGAVTVICSLLALIMAPWEIQMLLLIVVIVVVTQLIAVKPKRTLESGETVSTQTYRGISYTETKKQPLITTEKPVVGKYRGVIMPIQHVEPQSQTSPKPKKYRGIEIP